MYCKFCAENIGQGNVTKCPKCGLAIDLNDGGQSFFEDIDLITWSQKNEEAASATPKTEIRRVVQQVPQRGVAHSQAKGMQVNRTAFNGKADKPFREITNEFIIKAGVICTAVVIVFALLILLISQCSNNETEGNNTTDDNIPKISDVEIDDLDEIVKKLDEKAPSEPPAVDTNIQNEQFEFSFILYDSDEHGNLKSKDIKESTDQMYYDLDETAQTYLVPIDDFIGSIGYYKEIKPGYYTAKSSDDKDIAITVKKNDAEDSGYEIIILVNGVKYVGDYQFYKFKTICKEKLHCFDIKLLFDLVGYQFGEDYEIKGEENILTFSGELAKK